MRFANPRIWISIASAAAVLYLVMGDIFRTSPGPLTSVHQRDSTLTGFRSCTQCHGGWFSSMSESCLQCHIDIDEQVQATTGLHGSVGNKKALRCALCHSEHKGSNFALVNQLSFLHAGIQSREDFDHSVVDFAMVGRHLELDCRKCHENADVDLLPEGGRRFLGLNQDCAKCHEDAHDGRMRLGCTSCHGQQSFNQLHSEGHDKYLSLVGGHAGVDCLICHLDNEAHSLDALGSGKEISQRACPDCHDSPHQESFIAGVAQLAASTPKASCASCHKVEHVSFADAGEDVTPKQHAASGFKLDEPHDQASCEDCHASDIETFAARFPGRGQDDCVECHADPHGGQFDQGPFAKIGCLACHDRREFMPHAFGIEEHARASFELTGQHAENDCNECHKLPATSVESSTAVRLPAADRPRVFRGTPSDCARCHGDAHVGFFDKFAAELGETRHGACAACHLTTKFAELPEGGFNHSKWTGFPILGAHAQIECDRCHKASAEADEHGRTFGRIAAQYGAFKGCVTCHRDPHDGGFDQVHLPRKVEGRSGCLRCHVPASFRTLRTGFDHGLWTGFALAGAHGTVDCSACHTPLRTPDAAGRTWGRVKGSRCADCHEDPHADQFAVRGQTNCRRCHRGAARFRDLVFNHEIHSRFPLGKAHKNLACTTCHKPIAKTTVLRYRPLKRLCVDCHGAQDDPFRRRRRRKR